MFNQMSNGNSEGRNTQEGGHLQNQNLLSENLSV